MAQNLLEEDSTIRSSVLEIFSIQSEQASYIEIKKYKMKGRRHPSMMTRNMFLLVLLWSSISLAFGKSPPMAPTQQQPLVQTALNPENYALAESSQRRRRHLKSVTTVASVNVAINILRPDSFVTWQVRRRRQEPNNMQSFCKSYVCR